MRDIARIEWELWRDLCKRLEESGLVTDDEFKSPANENKSDGQKLIHAIKAWAADRSNDIARAIINQRCGANEYVVTAIREWAEAFAILEKEDTLAEVIK